MRSAIATVVRFVLERGIVGISGGVRDDEPVRSEDAPSHVGDLSDGARARRMEVVAHRGRDVLLEVALGRCHLARQQPAKRLGAGDGARQLQRLDDDGHVFLPAEEPPLDLRQVGRVDGAKADSPGRERLHVEAPAARLEAVVRRSHRIRPGQEVNVPACPPGRSCWRPSAPRGARTAGRGLVHVPPCASGAPRSAPTRSPIRSDRAAVRPRATPQRAEFHACGARPRGRFRCAAGWSA